MKLITRYELAQTAPTRWLQCYAKSKTEWHQAVNRQMEALAGTVVTPDTVDSVIGNTSWTKPSACSECGQEGDRVMQVGQEPDYESHTAYLCLACLRKATGIMAAA